MKKKTLDHLPKRNINELKHIQKVLFQCFDTDKKQRMAANIVHDGQILKLMVFGSYARGTQVEQDSSGYMSDFDILVVVDREYLTDDDGFWAKAEHRLNHELPFRTSVNILCHSLKEMNRHLKAGHYFFRDIWKDAVPFYEVKGYPLEQAKKPSPQDAYGRVKDYLDDWLPIAEGFLDTYEYCRSQGRMFEAMFQLFQAADRAYHCILLALTDYSPQTHDLDKLRSLCEEQESRLRGVFPRDNRQVRERYQKFKRTYVDLWDPDKVDPTEEELDWMGERVTLLLEKTRQIGEKRLRILENMIPKDA